ncbi:MAG: Na/Pi cotransporter family protein [Lachnospiraceae bacterium]|nr:Na/Pi cotransporter family protein [Lachnospiraceae bacterium]
MMKELLSGLALFLFGMKYMGDSLQQAAGPKLRGFLDKCTKNKYIGVVFGALFTAFIQSSGATTVMEVGFVNAGILTLERSVGLTFGANIGTTITSQLVSLKLTAVAPFIIFIGAALIMFGKKPMLRKIANVIFGFGALFLGINFMTNALGAIPDYPSIVKLFTYLENPFIAVLLGLVLTVIVQSSSVTVSVLVLLAGANVVAPMSCLFFILGANIGSCTPAVMAAADTNKNAKRTAAIHVLFNVIGLIVISIALAIAGKQIVDFIMSISGEGNLKRFVANADTIFKIAQCLILLPFTKQLILFSKKIIPSNKNADEEDEFVLKYIDEEKTPSPTIAVVQVVKEVERMASMVRLNLVASMEALVNNDRKNAEDIYSREEYIDFLSHRITEYMVKANQYGLPLEDRKRLGGLFHVVIDIERIGDHAVNIMDDAVKEDQEKINFSEEGSKEITDMYDKVIEIFDKSVVVFSTSDSSMLEQVNKIEDTIDDMKVSCQEGHVRRMAEGRCSIEAGLIFTDLVIGLERIADHATNIAFSILPEKR